jgi:Rad3-related DNA helicase
VRDAPGRSLRLKRADGRLVRRATDTGMFVLLDPAFPSRLHGAFPEGIVPERIASRTPSRARRCFSMRQADNSDDRRRASLLTLPPAPP